MYEYTTVKLFLEKNSVLIDQIDKTSKIHPDLINSLKSSGLFGMTAADDQEIFFTEIGRFVQV